MGSRRAFITKATLATAALATPSFLRKSFATPFTMEGNLDNTNGLSQLPANFGVGGVAAGNGWHTNPDAQIQEMLNAAWEAGVRYYDTSPWYGLGLSERRFGHFLFNKKREDYVLSTKIGRILEGDKDFSLPNGLWKGKLNFSYKYDYSAAGVRRSVEDSLQRLGVPYIDIVYIHDLSPDNGDMGEDWTKYFEQAAKGAIPELAKMKEEGLIKGWGLGVNTIEPILKTLEIASPDICLSATQYSLLHHEDAVKRLLPACEQHHLSLVIGCALNGGYLAGQNRFNYGATIPKEMADKKARMEKLAKKHNVDLRTAALQFSAAPRVVAAVLPGASTAEQAKANVESMKVKIPADFWKDMKSEKLIDANAPIPA